MSHIEVLRRIVRLDGVDGTGAEERRTVTLNEIIDWARESLSLGGICYCGVEFTDGMGEHSMCYPGMDVF